MIALVFLYEARDTADFEAAYGPDGDWTQFFQGARGYIGTELLRDVAEHGRYVVIDRWESSDTYNEFLDAHRDEYMRLSDELSFNFVQELRFGTFENAS